MRIPAAWLLAAWPRLVLYRFDPWLDLREYLTYRANLRSVRRYVEKFGRALARLHRSGCAFRVVEPDGAERRQMFVRTEAMLQTLPRGPELVDRFGDSIERIQEGSAGGRPQILTPIHGALGWDCIRYGIDGEFYLYRFESCRRSDPRLDLGGFAADLLSFTLAAYDDAAYRLCSNAFLSNYNRKAEHSVFEEDLQPFIVLALCERLQRAESDPKAGVGPLLRALDSALGQKHDQWGSS